PAPLLPSPSSLGDRLTKRNGNIVDYCSRSSIPRANVQQTVRRPTVKNDCDLTLKVFISNFVAPNVKISFSILEHGGESIYGM
ncbi:hypothetical protein BLOT_008441, partial [Blomia tropicalis]